MASGEASQMLTDTTLKTQRRKDAKKSQRKIFCLSLRSSRLRGYNTVEAADGRESRGAVNQANFTS
jgi:hypothetical protein